MKVQIIVCCLIVYFRAGLTRTVLHFCPTKENFVVRDCFKYPGAFGQDHSF